MKRIFCVGTYTEPILFGTGEVFRGKGEGVYLCGFDGKNIGILGCVPLVNPSFVCLNEAKRKIYAVGETKEYEGAFGGSVSEIDYREDFSMTMVKTLPTGGTDPCHVALSPDGTLLAVANFASGALTVFPVDGQGSIREERSVFQHEGGGADPARQTGPHAHSCIFDGYGLLLVPDLGKDEVILYRAEDGRAQPVGGRGIRTQAGSGPRYGEFSADGGHFYLINEMASTVSHYRWDGREARLRETVSTLPERYEGENTCADLHLTPDGRYLYASNRGHDSLAVFAVQKDGSLCPRGHVPSGGRTPRQFQIDPEGQYVFIGNQDSDCIAVYAIEQDGGLRWVSSTPFPSPVCIRFFQSAKLFG